MREPQQAVQSQDTCKEVVSPSQEGMVIRGHSLSASHARDTHFIMKTFWILLGLGSACFLVLCYFFLVGLEDGSVNAINMAIWLPVVCGAAAILLGGLYLKGIGRPGLAKGLLALLAVPGLLAGAWMLLMVILLATHPGAYR